MYELVPRLRLVEYFRIKEHKENIIHTSCITLIK